MSGTDLQKWGDYDLDAAAEEKEALAKEGSAGFMKLEVGKNIARIFPPAPGRKTPFLVVYQHYVDLPDGGRYSFPCPRMMAKRQCPVCSEAATLARSKNSADNQRARDLAPKRRVFAVVLNRKDESAGPQILGFGKTIHEALVALRQDEDMGGNYTHPIKGIDVVIERTGNGKFDTKYTVNLARKPRPIVNDAALMDQLREQMPDLTRLALVPDNDEIEAKLNGEEPPSRGGKGGGGQRLARAQDSAFDDSSIDAEFEEMTDDDSWGLKG
jgi:hypothetical protein